MNAFIRLISGAVVLLALVSAGCGGEPDEENRAGNARAAAAVVRELQRAFADRDLAALCKRMTPDAKLEAGRVAHGKPGACESDLRETFAVIESGGGFDERRPRLLGTRVNDTRAFVTIAGRHGRTEVPLAWQEDRWLLDSFFGTPPAIAERVAAGARRRPFPSAAAEPVTLADSTGQPCFDPFVDLPNVTGDCGYRAAARLPITIATAFGEFRFGVCEISIEVTTGSDGRGWTAFGASSPVNNGCADVKACSVDGERIPWKSRISQERRGSLVQHIDACLDTCIGAYVGELELSLPQETQRTTVTTRSPVGTSGLVITGHLTVIDDDIRV